MTYKKVLSDETRMGGGDLTGIGKKNPNQRQRRLWR
jgi:hypothetical protein